ncbi:hypothetical protein GTW43_33315 [Streptomyces sp. SID5785]|uniref:hypothetical protein n=1 Tax=Streptomyces sp. SID5785 TaxID=2690309 RepID=UPI001361A742|nr:hypothetical protein [Streptomyces sp. SID5785]MZD09926.1 hypothetical protein [Streptomyces sp. SID5785]
MKRGAGVGRAVVAVAASVGVGVLASGCGGDGAQAVPKVTHRTLTKAELSDAVLSGSVKGFRFLGGAQEPPVAGAGGGTPACGNTGGVLAGRIRPEAEAQLLVTGTDEREPRLVQTGPSHLLVQAHRQATARAVLDTLRTDLKDCAPFTSADHERTKAVRDPAPAELGDGAVAYRLVAGKPGVRPHDTVVVVVRAGSVVMAASGSAVASGRDAVKPVRASLERLVRAQIDRLPKDG